MVGKKEVAHCIEVVDTVKYHHHSLFWQLIDGSILSTV